MTAEYILCIISQFSSEHIHVSCISIQPLLSCFQRQGACRQTDTLRCNKNRAVLHCVNWSYSDELKTSHCLCKFLKLIKKKWATSCKAVAKLLMQHCTVLYLLLEEFFFSSDDSPLHTPINKYRCNYKRKYNNMLLQEH